MCFFFFPSSRRNWKRKSYTYHYWKFLFSFLLACMYYTRISLTREEENQRVILFQKAHMKWISHLMNQVILFCLSRYFLFSLLYCWPSVGQWKENHQNDFKSNLIRNFQIIIMSEERERRSGLLNAENEKFHIQGSHADPLTSYLLPTHTHDYISSLVLSH